MSSSAVRNIYQWVQTASWSIFLTCLIVQSTLICAVVPSHKGSFVSRLSPALPGSFGKAVGNRRENVGKADVCIYATYRYVGQKLIWREIHLYMITYKIYSQLTMCYNLFSFTLLFSFPRIEMLLHSETTL
jgi:hypothetical protein